MWQKAFSPKKLKQRCWWLLATSTLLLGTFPFLSSSSLFSLEEKGWFEGQVERLIAGFIYNFPAYITWPQEDFSVIRIAFIGPNPLTAARAYLHNRPFRDKTYQVTHLTEWKKESLSDYQMIYFGKMPKKDLENLLKKIERDPIVTIGMEETFAQIEDKPMILFHVSPAGAVTFDVNEQAIGQAGLTFNPQLITYGETM